MDIDSSLRNLPRKKSQKAGAILLSFFAILFIIFTCFYLNDLINHNTLKVNGVKVTATLKPPYTSESDDLYDQSYLEWSYNGNLYGGDIKSYDTEVKESKIGTEFEVFIDTNDYNNYSRVDSNIAIVFGVFLFLAICFSGLAIWFIIKFINFDKNEEKFNNIIKNQINNLSPEAISEFIAKRKKLMVSSNVFAFIALFFIIFMVNDSNKNNDIIGLIIGAVMYVVIIIYFVMNRIKLTKKYNIKFNYNENNKY